MRSACAARPSRNTTPPTEPPLRTETHATLNTSTFKVMQLRPLVVVLFAALPVAMRAQMHKVEAPQRVTRAIGVYEWTGDLAKPTASRLVPVSLFIDSHFEDAGVYLARPVPFVLQTGDIYSIETAGQPVGTLDLDVARDIVPHSIASGNLADDTMGSWYGYGRFQPPAAEKPPARLKAVAHPATLSGGSDDDDTPHFVVRHPNDTAASNSGPRPSSTPDATPDPSTTTTTTTSTTDTDSDRPTLRRRDAPAPDNSKRNKREKPQGYVTGPNDSLNDDPDRPTLHRGVLAEEGATAPLTGLPANLHQAVAVSDAANREPHIFTREWESSAERAQTLADFEKLARPRLATYIATNKLQPVAASLVASPAPSAPTSGVSSQTASDVSSRPKSAAADASERPAGGAIVQHQETAAPVTDATTAAAGNPIAPGAGDAPSLHDRNNPTSSQPGAPSSTGGSIAEQGGVGLPSSARATQPPPTSPRPRPGTARSRKPTAPTPLALSSEELRGYELSYGALPAFVYTAQSPVATGGPVYITLVAQRLPSGELQTALASVTDASHLDRVPWMRLVDAVDPDWSHRADLLFELRAQNSRQFALYRLVTAQAEQTFATGVIQ